MPNRALLTHLAQQATIACSTPVHARVGFAPRSMRAFPMTRVDKPGSPLTAGERAVFEIDLGNRPVRLRSFWWPVGTTIYSLKVGDAEPIVVRRSHFQEPSWYGFKLQSALVRAGTKLRVEARINPGSTTAFAPEVDADIV